MRQYRREAVKCETRMFERRREKYSNLLLQVMSVMDRVQVRSLDVTFCKTFSESSRVAQYTFACVRSFSCTEDETQIYYKEHLRYLFQNIFNFLILFLRGQFLVCEER